MAQSFSEKCWFLSDAWERQVLWNSEKLMNEAQETLQASLSTPLILWKAEAGILLAGTMKCSHQSRVLSK